MTLSEGDVLLKRYQILGPLGSGGMATVYEAVDTIDPHSRHCAVKELLFSYWNTPYHREMIAAFYEEAKILRTIEHRNLPKIYDFFGLGDDYYLIMEYIEGPDLQTRVNQEGRIPEQEVLDWMDQVMDALMLCHENNVIHRDIKPDNIKITKGHAYLIDFGVARKLLPGDKTQPKLSVSSGVYSPLEYHGSEGRADRRSDIYSLGATIYLLLTGEPPLYPVDRALGMEMKNLRFWNPDVSETVDRAVMKALEVKPQDRFQTVAEFRNALQSLADRVVAPAETSGTGDEPVSPRGPATPPGLITLQPSPKRHSRSRPEIANFQVQLPATSLPSSFAIGTNGGVFLGWSAGQVSQYRREKDVLQHVGTVTCGLPAQSIAAYQGEGNQGLSCAVFAKDRTGAVLIDIPGLWFAKGTSTSVAPLRLHGDVRYAARHEQEQYLLSVASQAVYLGRFEDQEGELIPECRKPVGLVVTSRSFFVADTVLDGDKKRSRIWFWNRHRPGEWRALPDIAGETVAITAELQKANRVFLITKLPLVTSLVVYDAVSGAVDARYHLDDIQGVRGASADSQHLWVLDKHALYRLPYSWLSKHLVA